MFWYGWSMTYLGLLIGGNHRLSHCHHRLWQGNHKLLQYVCIISNHSHPLPGGHLLDVNGSTCCLALGTYAYLWWLKHETDPIGCEPNIGNWNNSVSVASQIFPPPLVSYTSSPLTNILNNPCNFLSWKCNSCPSLPIQDWCRFSPEILYFLKLVPISNLPLSFFISLFLLFSQPL